MKIFGGKKDDFESVFVEAAKRVGARIIRMDKERAEISYGGKPGTVGFSNVRADFAKLPKEERPRMVEWFLRSIVSSMQPSKEAPFERIVDSLMPVVRLPFDPKAVEKMPPSKTLVPPFLYAFVVVDTPSTMEYVNQEDLDRWATTFDKVYELAVANLRRRSSRNLLQSDKGLPGLLFYATVPSPDAYEASRFILMKELIDPWPNGGVLFSVPSRNSLICVPFRSMEAIKALQPLAALTLGVYRDDSHKIACSIFWYDGTNYEIVPLGIEDNKPKVTIGERLGKMMSQMIERETRGGRAGSVADSRREK